MITLLRHTLAVALALVGTSTVVLAQRPPGDPAYKLGPAIAGNNGRVFVGTLRGTILYATSTSSGISVTDSATPGGLLPAETQAIWALSMPNRTTQPQLVFALASYSDGANSRYGILRSTDLGTSWTLTKDAALADDRFRPTNDFWGSTGLTEFTWLENAQHGWVFGPGGIIATTDGGATWGVRLARNETERNNVQALSFRDANNGVAAIGWSPEERFRVTSDGGVTWRSAISPSSPIGALRVNQMDWIGNQFRAFVFDRTALSDRGKITTYFYRSTDFGDFWDGKPKGTITVEQTPHTEILWHNARTGFMVMRSGYIAATQDGGATWASLQAADSAAYPMPINMQAGFGYTSILLDGRYIVQAATIDLPAHLVDSVMVPFRRLDTLVQWDLGTASNVRFEPRALSVATIAPTPAHSFARLVLERPLAAGARLTVLDATGAVRRVEALEAGATGVDIDVAALATGVYRVVVDDAAGRISAPLVLAR